MITKSKKKNIFPKDASEIEAEKFLEFVKRKEEDEKLKEHAKLLKGPKRPLEEDIDRIIKRPHEPDRRIRRKKMRK